MRELQQYLRYCVAGAMMTAKALLDTETLEILAGAPRDFAVLGGVHVERGHVLRVELGADPRHLLERPAELAYRIGFNPLHRRVWRGQ